MFRVNEHLNESNLTKLYFTCELSSQVWTFVDVSYGKSNQILTLLLTFASDYFIWSILEV